MRGTGSSIGPMPAVRNEGALAVHKSCAEIRLGQKQKGAFVVSHDRTS